MADNITKILDIKVNYDQAIQKTVEYKQAIKELQDQQKELRAAQKEDPDNAEKYARDIEVLNSKIAVYKDGVQKLTKATQNQIREQQSNEGSLVQLRARLSNLTAEYDALSQEMRNSKVGQQLKNQINDVTTALKAEEEATQRFYRNVGNYENAVRDALGNLNSQLTETQRRYAEVVASQGAASKEAEELKTKMEGLQYTIAFTEEASEGMNNALYSFIPFGNTIQKMMPLLSKGLSGVKEAFSLAATGAKALGQQLLTLMANPIVAFLGMLAAAIALVVSGIKGSEENMNQWNRIMAPVQRGLTAIRSVIETLCGWILNFVEAGSRMLGALMKIAEAATSIFPSISNAIHDINAAVEENIRLAEREAQLRKDNREFLVEEAKTQAEIAELKAVAEDKTRSAEERLKANQEAVAKEQELLKERLRLAEEELAIEQARAEQAGNSAEDNDKLAQLEANLYRLRKETADKTRELNNKANQIEKSISDERKKRHEEYKKQQEEKAKAAKEASDKEIAALKALEDAMLANVEEGYDKRRQVINLQYDREIEGLRKRLEEEQNLTENARDAINQLILEKERQRQSELNQVSEQSMQDEINRQQQLMQTRLDSIREDAEAEKVLKLQLLNMEMEAELALYENDEEMKNAITEKYQAERNDILNEYNQKRKAEETKQAEKEVQIQQAKYDSIGSLAGNASKMFDQLGQKNKEFAILSKTLALAEIAINTGKALAAGIAQAQSVPFPANIAAIATTVGTILGNITAAISTVQSAKFATGGKVTGAGTGTSDSIPAMLSNGEFVMTAKATSMYEPLLKAMNATAAQPSVILPTSYQTPITSGQSAEQNIVIADAIKEMHPVVSVVDINDGQQRVEAIQNLDNI